jgi:hypothetical protein
MDCDMNNFILGSEYFLAISVERLQTEYMESKHFLLIPTDAHYYKIVEMVKII